MQLLFAELKRIEGQQQQLKTAVAQNKVLVVHPPKGFAGPSVDNEYAEEEEAPRNPDRFIPSGPSDVALSWSWRSLEHPIDQPRAEVELATPMLCKYQPKPRNASL